MVNLLYAQVIQTLIEQTREQKLVWEIHELSRYPELEPESLVSKPYFTRFKGRNMLLSQERMPPYKLDSDVIIRLRFLDDAGKFVEDFPNVSNLSKLYEVVRVASRSDVDKQMDKVVEALALATKAQQITWTEEKPEIFSIEAETLTSPVYVTEFKGKKFVLFYEHEGSSTRKNVQTRPSLWILDLNNTKLYDCRDVLGIDILFRLVNTKKPDFSALDAMVDALVSSAIKDVVARMQLEGKKGEA